MADSDLTLYFMPHSFYAQKAHLALLEKGLTFKKRLMLLGKNETYQPWYMKMNPKGQIPTLQHGDKYIPDSAKIIEYLDATFPDKKLQPDVRTDIGRRVHHFQHKLDEISMPTLTIGCISHPELMDDPELSYLARKVLGKYMSSGSTIESLEKLAAANPDLKSVYEEKLKHVKHMFSTTSDTEKVVAEIEKANRLMGEIEAELKKRSGDEWLCGKDFTVADVILAVTLHRFKFLGLQRKLFGKEERPLLRSYYERLLKRPSFITASVKAKFPLPLRLITYGPPLVGAAVVLGAAVGVGYWLYKRDG